MSDGTELHVTERELLTMPPEYKSAAIPLNAAPTPQLLPIPPASPVPQVHTDDLPRQRHPKRRVHPLLYLGIGMLAMLALWSILLSAIAWYNTQMDDIHYGRPRTFQFDAVVHHNNDSILTPTHLIVINLNRKVEVIEQPAGDSSHMQVYIAATLIEDGSELFPVTAYIKDVTGDGLPDIVLTVKGAHFVLINTGTRFRLAKQGDHITI